MQKEEVRARFVQSSCMLALQQPLLQRKALLDVVAASHEGEFRPFLPPRGSFCFALHARVFLPRFITLFLITLFRITFPLPVLIPPRLLALCGLEFFEQQLCHTRLFVRLEVRLERTAQGGLFEEGGFASLRRQVFEMPPPHECFTRNLQQGLSLQGAVALSFPPLDHKLCRLCSLFQQQFLQRGFVFQIASLVLAALFADAVEGGLRNVEVALPDKRGHVAKEEGEQERADVAAVDIGVGHDDDGLIAQLVGGFVSVRAVLAFSPVLLLRRLDRLFEPDAKRRDHRADFYRREDLVLAHAFDIEDLAA